MHDSPIRVMVYESICLHFGKVSTDIERYRSLQMLGKVEGLLKTCVQRASHIKEASSLA